MQVFMQIFVYILHIMGIFIHSFGFLAKNGFLDIIFLKGFGAMETTLIIIIYFIIVNICGFASMGIDKSRARNRRWRIPEAMLFFFAIIGGSLGSTVGMHLFHHKTKHWYFRIGFPLILIIQIILAILLVGIPGIDINIM